MCLLLLARGESIEALLGEPSGIALRKLLYDLLPGFTSGVNVTKFLLREPALVIRLGHRIGVRVPLDHIVVGVDGVLILSRLKMRLADQELRIVRLISRGKRADE